MSVDGKIQSLNQAIRDSLPNMCQVAEENPNAHVLIRSLQFSHGATWHVATPTPIERFQWQDLQADPLEKPTLDIVFLIDTSGSMGDEIAGVKESCLAFASRIIQEGANVRLGLVGFDIGGHQVKESFGYQVHQLSRYTIGVWPLDTPESFQKNIQSLRVGLFGGAGCYLANQDTVDIFPHVVRLFDNSAHQRLLVIISDEMGNNSGLSIIVAQLQSANIITHVLGISGPQGAHQLIAQETGGKFWDIRHCQGKQDFSSLLDSVAASIAEEITTILADGTLSTGTDMGKALEMVGEVLRIPPMSDRALPPVLVLISDGQPTDNFAQGLEALMSQPWGKKAVRIAIAIGSNSCQLDVLQKFIGHDEIFPLQANNAENLTHFIRWASTVVLKAVSTPMSQHLNPHQSKAVNVPLMPPPPLGPSSAGDLW
jgi:uncharacterized protein YegL